MKTYRIEWDLTEENGDSCKISIADLPDIVDVPEPINTNEVCDWLSEDYGLNVKSLTLIKS